MTDDLTKLSGPELADWLDTVAAGYDRLSSMPGRTSAEGDRLRESARRHREDTREWQRNLERERDTWRSLAELRERELTGRSNNREFVERLKRWEQWAEGVRCDVGTDDEAMDAIGDRCAALRRIEVILGVEDSEEEGAGYEALRKVVSERDTLRARLEAEMSKPIAEVKLVAGDAYVADLLRDLDHWKGMALVAQAVIDRDDSIAMGMSTAELVAEVKRARETRGCLISEVQQLKAVVANQRKELHTLNKERKATLTKLEETQLDNSRICARIDDALKERGSLRESAGKAFNDRARWRDWADGFDCVTAGAGDDDAMDAIGSSFVALSKRIAELEEQRELDAGSLRSAINNAQSRLAQVKRLESQLRDAQNAGADEWAEDGEAVPEPATVVSTAALSAFDVAAANAAVAMHVDADGLGFVKRDWLERHRGLEQSARAQIQAAWGAGPGTTPLSGPAERTVQEERMYGPDARTVDDVLRCNGWVETTTHHLAIHLRETLATLKAVEALAARWESRGAFDLVRARDFASELREVLNGKR